MDRKIIGIMVTLVAVLIVVMVVVLAFVGGGLSVRAGGFTSLFDDLENPAGGTHNQELAMPTNWRVNDVMKVSDTIVDLSYYKQTVAQTTVYVTTLYFAYMGDKWNDPFNDGSNFNVPDNSFDGWMGVGHGVFHITVSSATNLSAHYQPGDVIKLEVVLQTNVNGSLAFGEWSVANTI